MAVPCFKMKTVIAGKGNDLSGFLHCSKGEHGMTTHRICRRWLPWLVSTLALAGLMVALSPNNVPAQATKKKTDPKTEKTKKDGKLEPPPSTFPARVDDVDGTKPGTEQIAYIDEHITRGWKDNNTYPSERCTDYEFIRRASLDIIGRIPKVEEIGTFMKQPAKTRRAWLVNALLEGKEYGNGTEYAQNFANMWTVSLMTRTGSQKHYQEQMNDWLAQKFKGGDDYPADWSKIVTEIITAQGDENRNQAINYVIHNLGEKIKQDANKNGQWDMVPATSRTTRLFLGIRTQCVQCHDHPFQGEWGQHHFWGINAFFRQVDTKNEQPSMMMAKKKKKGEKADSHFNLSDNRNFNGGGLIPYERRNTSIYFTDPTYLSGKKIPKDFTGTRREALAKFITEDPFFAKAFVNRTWGHFFGKSFTKDNADDFGEHNPISHPALLEQLASDFAKKFNHNPRELIRWICNSQAYGLSSRANRWNDKTEDETLFARMLLKPMSPEQMFESMMVATQARLGQNKEKRLEAKQEWFSRLIINFGNDEGEEVYAGTVIQALLLMNGQDINNAINDEKEGTVAAIVKRRGSTPASLRYVVNDLFLHTLTRPPTDKELADLTRKEVYSFRPGSRTQPNTPQFWHHYYQDIFWALLNSNEFILNH
jgi:hypothetical protein